MTPEQFQIFIKENERATGEAINKFVNGKIDIMNGKLDDHIVKHEKQMETIAPIIEAYKGTKVVGEIMKWISSVGLGAFGLWAMMKGIIK